jgi:radical SAM superfamily enzyme YgiQ (UPF0313 family)
MNICLITAPTITEFKIPDEINCGSVLRSAREPQLGILSLAAVVEKQGHDVHIFDLNRSYLDYAASVASADDGFVAFASRLIVANDSDVYGFGTICSSYPLTIRIAEAVKLLRADSLVVLGGPQASVVDLETLTAFPFVDMILRGEAERSFPLLLEEIAGTRNLDKVDGLTYRGIFIPQRNCNSRVIEDLDSLPPPAYHLTDCLAGANRASLELGRGCPFACKFCSTNDFFRRNFRLHSPGRMLHDMRAIAAHYAIRDFDLTHDMFTVDRRRVVAFCETLISAQENFTWACSARTDCVDQELLEIMALAGCTGIFLGVESGSQRIQAIIGKHLDPKWAESVVDAADRLGIRTTVSLIAGFPEETWDDVKDTMRMFMYSARHSRSNPQLNVLAPLAATPIYSAHRNELILDDLCSDLSAQSANRNTADFSLIRAYPEIFPNFYLIPTPFLDRSCILELREFSLVGIECFRWLLSAIEQSNIDISDLFLAWREYRCKTRPHLSGFDLRRFYQLEFRTEFLRFLRGHALAKEFRVEVLIDYETRITESLSIKRDHHVAGETLSVEAPLNNTDIIVSGSNIHLIESSADLQQLLDGLKTANISSVERGRKFYVGREESAGVIRFHSVSDWMACVVRGCEKPRALADLLEQLAIEITDVEEHDRLYTFPRLIRAAQMHGFIDIFSRVNDVHEVDRSAACLQ